MDERAGKRASAGEEGMEGSGAVRKDGMAGSHELPQMDAPTADLTPDEEAWKIYEDVAIELEATIPLCRMCVRELKHLEPGVVLQSLWPRKDDVILSAKQAFVGNVSLEPADDRLGFRMNDFTPERMHPVFQSNSTGRKSLLQAQGEVDDLEVVLQLCFGRKLLRLADALKLTPGELVAFDQGIHDEVKVVVKGRTVASGVLLLVGECYGVRISSLSSGASLPPAAS